MSRLLAGAALVLAVGACGRGEPGADSVVAARGTPATPANAANTSGCPRTGHWNECGVKLRLGNAGLVSIPAKKIDDLPSLGVDPLLYSVGGRDLAVYIFPDAAARGRAAVTLDTSRFVPATRALTARGETTLIETDNLLALLSSRNDQQRERVTDALQVGPPQP